MSKTPADPNTSLSARRLPLAWDPDDQREPNGRIVGDLHRGPDGFIPIARKVDGHWESLGAMPVREPWLPELLGELVQDGYVALNTSFRTGTRYETRQAWTPATEVPLGHPTFGDIALDFPGAEVLIDRLVKLRIEPITGLPVAYHRSDSLRWLNVAHVDIDCHRVGLSVGDCIGAIIDAQDKKLVPPATAFVRSGRGVWAFWLLVDVLNPETGERLIHGVTHRPDTPQRASARAVALYARIQRQLAEVFAPLGADLGAIDATRFGPFPGTTKTYVDDDGRVYWWLQGARGAACYTLPQLAVALGLETSAVAHPVIAAALAAEPEDRRRRGKPKDAVKARAGRRGWAVRWRSALRDFEILRRLRGGGFADGMRHVGCLYYATLLSRAPTEEGTRMDSAAIARHLADYAAACRPPLPAPDVRMTLRTATRSLNDGNKRRFPRNSKMWAQLEVTPAEASYLETMRAPEPPRRRSAERRATIEALITSAGTTPTTRRMATLLREHGFRVSHATVAADYRRLKVPIPMTLTTLRRVLF